MIDLAAYYIKHHSGYYDKFAREVSGVTYVLTDQREIIDTFKSICKPPETDYPRHEAHFVLICFWLYKNGYSIAEFPNLLSRPASLQEFAYQDIRKYLMKRDGYSGNVSWQDRRELCDSLTVKSNGKFQSVPDEVEDLIITISTRGADFDSMALDERLSTLNNLLENLLKKNGKFISLKYDDIFFGYVTENQVVDLRKKTHCFRHGDAQAVEDRKKYSKEEKELLVDLGVFITIHIHRYINKA
jgi:hypothetical protein